MRLTGNVGWLSIVLDEDDLGDHEPHCPGIVERGRGVGPAGATARHGCNGSSGSPVIRTYRRLDLADDPPATVSALDVEERPLRLDELLGAGTVFVDDVDIHRCEGNPLP